MKKYILIFLSIAIAFSCKKNTNEIFNKSPDERINESISKSQSILTGAENGWKAFITTDNGNGNSYSFYFKFDNNNRVKMVSDFNDSTVLNVKESSYRIKQQQQPTLIFDTYSYIHLLADPNDPIAVNPGPPGKGLSSDFEFILDNDNISADSIKMVGKANGTKITLTKASKAEADFFTTGQWKLFTSYLKNLLTYYARLNLNGTMYDVRLLTGARTITFSWLDGGGNLQYKTCKYYNTFDGSMVLSTPFQNGNQAISSISFDNWDANTSTVNAKINNQAVTFKETILPLKVNKDFATVWSAQINTNNSYYYTVNSFSTRNKDDFFNLKSIPNYYFCTYLSKDFLKTPTDLFVAWNLSGGGLNILFPFFRMSFTIDNTGLVKFKNSATSNGSPSFTQIKNSNTQLIQANGYYIVRNEYFDGVSTFVFFDMVSAKDGKTWLSWDLP